jgi:hypothetical protein
MFFGSSQKMLELWGSLGLYFVGHMVWAYVWAAAVWALVSRDKRGGGLFLSAILMLGVLPDVDLFLGSLGVVHHTFTHSLFFWLVIFAPLLLVYRGKSVPYFVAVVQHFAFGDFLVGKVMILWPFSLSYFGFSIAMPSVLDVLLETVGLLLAAGIVIFNGDLRRLLSVDSRNAFMLLPFLALATSMFFFAVDWSVVPLIAYVFSRKSLTILVLDHMILATFLVVSVTQGLRALKRKRSFHAHGGISNP